MSCTESFITVVSGLPRAGTSMMMQMLEAGGMPVLADTIRAADEDNLRGYYELQAVMRTRRDPSWVKDAFGRAVKIIYLLLIDLPTDYTYRVVFMRRNIDEVVRSQQTMLARRGTQGAGIPAPEMIRTFQRQLAECDAWLAQQPGFQVLDVEYRAVIEDALGQAHRVRDFLCPTLDVVAMVETVDPDLYRQRS